MYRWLSVVPRAKWFSSRKSWCYDNALPPMFYNTYYNPLNAKPVWLFSFLQGDYVLGIHMKGMYSLKKEAAMSIRKPSIQQQKKKKKKDCRLISHSGERILFFIFLSLLVKNFLLIKSRATIWPIRTSPCSSSSLVFIPVNWIQGIPRRKFKKRKHHSSYV